MQIGVAFLAGEFVEFDIGAVTSRSAFAWVYLTVIGTGAFSPMLGSCVSRRFHWSRPTRTSIRWSRFYSAIFWEKN